MASSGHFHCRLCWIGSELVQGQHERGMHVAWLGIFCGEIRVIQTPIAFSFRRGLLAEAMGHASHTQAPNGINVAIHRWQV